MRESLTYLAGLILIIAPIPYVIDIIRGETKPNMVTWVTWSLINVINTAAAFSVGAWQTGLYALIASAATITIATLGFWHGVRHYTRFDIACQALALLGIPIWLLTKQPALAVAVVLCVDFAGGLPTLRHAWRDPHEETLRSFALSALAAFLLLVSLSNYTFVAVAMPAYIMTFDTAICFSIITRRRSSRVARNADHS